MKKYDVNCVSCCGTFHETTAKFDNSRMATGDMFTMKQSHKENGWGSFPEYDSTDYPDIVCPSCGMMYCSDNGKVIRLQENGEIPIGTPTEVAETHTEVDSTPTAEKVVPEFDEEGRAQCPYCDERPNKQWWSRHLAKHQKSE